ncbi:DUF7079 family protein [Collimonas silvisoli]|uniref:DUF7079 family protein n=1 Tax=Collimonas silvisoli TaxID=2825884 RepID=UPI001B8C926A|nr:hypothetical protein [Collimonas silvisoli]
MENKLTQLDHEKIWIALSDAFVDTDVDFNSIAYRVRNFDLDIGQLNEIFFREVAPICGLNLMTTAPPVWHFFDEEYLLEQIYEMLQRRKKSFIFRVTNDVFIWFCRWNFREEWMAVQSAVLDKFETRPKNLS